MRKVFIFAILVKKFVVLVEVCFNCFQFLGFTVSFWLS